MLYSDIWYRMEPQDLSWMQVRSLFASQTCSNRHKWTLTLKPTMCNMHTIKCLKTTSSLFFIQSSCVFISISSSTSLPSTHHPHTHDRVTSSGHVTGYLFKVRNITKPCTLFAAIISPTAWKERGNLHIPQHPHPSNTDDFLWVIRSASQRYQSAFCLRFCSGERNLLVLSDL